MNAPVKVYTVYFFTTFVIIVMNAAHHHYQTGLFVVMFYGSAVASTSHPFPFDALLLQPSCESSPELFHPAYTKHIIILKNKKSATHYSN